MTASGFDPIWSGSVFQNSLYVGINIENILYGIELVLYFKTIHIILSNGRRHRKSDNFYAFFSTIMVFSTTAWIASQAAFGQQTWLLNPNFPGGPDAYWQEHISDWYMDWGTTAIIVLQLMTDGLMIHRCRIVWNSYRIIVIPIILWLATLALAILVDWTSSAPGGNIFSGLASELGLAYWTVSVFLNTTSTCLICYCIVRHAKRVQEHLGPEYASFYFTITMVVVESVLPYTVSGIAFLVSYGMGSATSIAFGSVYILMMCISPQMLILRVIVGRAWDNDTSKPQGSTIRFSVGATTESQMLDSTGATVHLHVLSDFDIPDRHEKV